MRNRIYMLAALCAIGAGCSSTDTASPRVPPTDHDLEGPWGEQFSVPGNNFTVDLAESSGVVTGVGSFAGEAGPFGSVVVNGTVANLKVQLQIVYNYEPHTFPTLGPDTAQFTGTLVAMDTLDGQLTRRGQTGALQLIRLKIGDPQ